MSLKYYGDSFWIFWSILLFNFYIHSKTLSFWLIEDKLMNNSAQSKIDKER